MGAQAASGVNWQRRLDEAAHAAADDKVGRERGLLQHAEDTEMRIAPAASGAKDEGNRALPRQRRNSRTRAGGEWQGNKMSAIHAALHKSGAILSTLLVLFPKEWDDLHFRQRRDGVRVFYGGFDLFSFPGNARPGIRPWLFDIGFMVDSAEAISLIEVNPRTASQFSDLYLKVEGVSLHELAVQLGCGKAPEPLVARGARRQAVSFVFRRFDGRPAVRPNAWTP